MKVQRVIVVTLMSAWVLASHLKVLHQIFFYVIGKALSGELSCMGTGLVLHVLTTRPVTGTGKLA